MGLASLAWQQKLILRKQREHRHAARPRLALAHSRVHQNQLPEGGVLMLGDWLRYASAEDPQDLIRYSHHLGVNVNGTSSHWKNELSVLEIA